MKHKTQVKKKVQKNVPVGIAHVLATFNNTIVTITDPFGNTISWSSAGEAEFSGSKKSSAFAAKIAAERAARKAVDAGMKEIEVNLDGPGAGRESAVRGLQQFLAVTAIRDITAIPHNGCRKPNPRSV